MRVDPWLSAHRSWVIAAAAVLPPLACVALAPFTDMFDNANAALLLVLLVVAAAVTGIRAAGLVAAITAAVGFDYFLTAPLHTLTITDAGDIETAVLLLLVGAAVSEIAVWGRRQAAQVSREQGYLAGAQAVAAAVAAGGSSTDDLVREVGQQIAEVLGVDGCRFDPAAGFGGPGLTADGGLVRHGRTIDVGRRGLPTDATIALPVRSGGCVYGHYLLISSTRVARPTRGQLRMAVMLADQVGAAIAGSRLAGAPAPPAPRTG